MPHPRFAGEGADATPSPAKRGVGWGYCPSLALSTPFTPTAPRSPAITFDRCATSRTSTSTSASMKSCLPIDDLQAGHRAFLLGDRIGQIGKRRRLIRADHADPSGMMLRLSVRPSARQRIMVPFDLDEPFRGRGKTRQCLTIPRVDRNALACRNDTNDLIARYRMAATSEVICHPRHQSGDRHVEVGLLRRPM